ncbi:MAG: nickel pincer cofactor biosynthesis protein LarC [Bryobacterales bacterium]|nr:nickel pincer cofactor biosynthesis protein LarC [Bryobacterales bacterium]
MKICYFDAFAGISGDMTVGALADAGADAAQLLAALESLDTGARYSLEKTKRRGIAASKFHVSWTDNKTHRHLPHIIKIIDGGAMSERARANAKLVFQKLGESESTVHGSPIEKVHFHEVGAADSIADIVGACVALDLLGVEAVACSAINVGSGTVSTEHGIMPVPTPAAALLLKGKPVYSRGPATELATPTGAAIVAALAGDFGPMPPLRIESVGYGAGDKDFPEHANVLRALIGQTTGARESTTVEVIEANIDDSTPEVLGWAMERLLEAGALDVTMQPLLMKKSRPGTLLRVLARPEDREKLAGLLMAETSSLGVRFFSAERRVQARRIVEVETAHGRARVKVAESGAFAPEYEDCRTLARSTGLPLQQILSEVSQAYTKNA